MSIIIPLIFIGRYTQKCNHPVKDILKDNVCSVKKRAGIGLCAYAVLARTVTKHSE